MFFTFPEDAAWNNDRDSVEFSAIVGQYEGTVRIARRVFQHLLDQSPTPERCMEAFHLQRTRFELIVERKLRLRQLTDDGNVEITSRDLREKIPRRRAELERLETAGNLTTDAHLAVLAMERGYILYSTDTDFAPISSLRWVNPLKEARGA